MRVPAGMHPRLRALLEAEGWHGLTAAQEAAWPAVHEGPSVLLVAPTGHGKTEAAMLPVFDRLLHARDELAARGKVWPKGFKGLYVTPLRALNRDLQGRLESWGKALDLPVGVRHGDTSAAERARQSRSPPDILITTPETVQLLLYGDTLRRHLGTLRFAILDEVHDLAASERGAQLAVALERIEEVVAQPEALRVAKGPERTCPEHASAQGRVQRIGLSATVAEPAPLARFIAGTGRPVTPVVVEAAKRLDLTVRTPVADDDDARTGARLGLAPEAAADLRVVRDIVAEHRRVLVFQNTRDAAEQMVSRSLLLDDEEPLLELHHGSLSMEHRQDVESRFKAGNLRGLVATSSLELGIDVGDMDHVVQVRSPRSTARLVQRLGRAGHRVGAISEGTLIAGAAEDAMECLAVARRAHEGRLEPIDIREMPLVVLANQLIALANEYQDLRKQWVFEVVQRAAPFAELDEDLFDIVWRTLQEVQTLYPGDAAGTVRRGGRARRHFLDHLSLIPDAKKYGVLDMGARRRIGTVDDAFVAAGLAPGGLFIMAGRGWRVLEIDDEAALVRVAQVRDIGAVPQWSGQQLAVSYEVAQEVARLRRLVAQNDEERDAYPGDAATWAVVADPIQRTLAAGLEVPTHKTVTLEVGTKRVTVNVALGTRGNEALGRITGALLHQRLGHAVGMESDAYRIHFSMDPAYADDLESIWRSLDPDTLDLLLAMVLRDQPLVRHHLVQVAKQFGALPKALDANRTSRKRLDALLENMALEEETLSRLAHDRLDLGAVADFLRSLDRIRVVKQALGPMSRLGDDERRRMVAVPRNDEALLKEVRTRLEQSDVVMACTGCGHHWASLAGDLPRRIHCRRCRSIEVACLRPWHEEQVAMLGRHHSALSAEDKKLRERLVRNGRLVGSFGNVAALCMVGRGVGPDTAVRILQKASDPNDPTLWREVLLAELTFARTSAFWS